MFKRASWKFLLNHPNNHSEVNLLLYQDIPDFAIMHFTHHNTWICHLENMAKNTKTVG